MLFSPWPTWNPYHIILVVFFLPLASSSSSIVDVEEAVDTVASSIVPALSSSTCVSLGMYADKGITSDTMSKSHDMSLPFLLRFSLYFSFSVVLCIVRTIAGVESRTDIANNLVEHEVEDECTGDEMQIRIDLTQFCDSIRRVIYQIGVDCSTNIAGAIAFVGKWIFVLGANGDGGGGSVGSSG